MNDAGVGIEVIEAVWLRVDAINEFGRCAVEVEVSIARTESSVSFSVSFSFSFSFSSFLLLFSLSRFSANTLTLMASRVLELAEPCR